MVRFSFVFHILGLSELTGTSKFTRISGEWTFREWMNKPPVQKGPLLWQCQKTGCIAIKGFLVEQGNLTGSGGFWPWRTVKSSTRSSQQSVLQNPPLKCYRTNPHTADFLRSQIEMPFHCFNAMFLHCANSQYGQDRLVRPPTCDPGSTDAFCHSLSQRGRGLRQVLPPNPIQCPKIHMWKVAKVVHPAHSSVAQWSLWKMHPPPLKWLSDTKSLRR